MNVTLELLRVSKMTNFGNSHREDRNIKFAQQVNEPHLKRVPLGTSPQEVVTSSLAHNQVTNLFISSYRGAIVVKFGQ